jgi:hypothetical protein
VDAAVPNLPITLRIEGQPFRTALRSLIRMASLGVPGLTFTQDQDLVLIKRRQGPPGMDDGMGGMLRNVAAQAAGTERGELFEYRVRQPVSLPRGQAAMVPIVSESIAGEALSLYDPAADPRHALNAFRLRNATALHLAGGPLTVFQAGVYAGDAQMGSVQPGEERLLTYAVDLDLVVGHQEPTFSQETTSHSARNGVLAITSRQQKEEVYTFRNKSDQPRAVLVQQPIEPGFDLVAPEKPAERTADRYRFLVTVPAKRNAALKVVTARRLGETLALLDADLNVVASYAKNQRASAPLRQALERLVASRGRVADLQAQRAGVEAELKAIDAEQSRIRQNMAQLDRNSALYQQYVRKLTDQEAEIEQDRKRVAGLRGQEATAQAELRAFLEKLVVD